MTHGPGGETGEVELVVVPNRHELPDAAVPERSPADAVRDFLEVAERRRRRLAVELATVECQIRNARQLNTGESNVGDTMKEGA